MPWFVRAECSPQEVDNYWSNNIEDGTREMEIIYAFAQRFPEGLFETLSTQLQQDAELRLDWANTIYIETEETKILIKRYVNAKTAEVNVSIQVSEYH